ncbi:hypothetical protein [Flavobacterium litorale]|uniref:Transcription elongation factor, GreA/GreB, C-term n=1 Tax=Flavobacterium litorale TaxID=2856519 RepID=A0ABX8V9J7_9FLAO|nr:hypothetical protein [Flavobacterium litorale]QYJ67495.1 hypothetical protein K1I41_07985 [Flavobacterium litorale]
MQDLKQKVVHYYKQQVQDREDAFRDMIAALTEDAKNDAKGSAGDKHETALSMMHLEQEKLNAKLGEILQQKAFLEKIDAKIVHNKIAIGGLVKANTMYLFISLALPKITVDGHTIIALSSQSPLGSKVMGMKIGDSFEIGTTTYCIKAIA